MVGGAWSSRLGARPHARRARPRPLPSRAPGKLPLSKVTAQGQPGRES